MVYFDHKDGDPKAEMLPIIWSICQPTMQHCIKSYILKWVLLYISGILFRLEYSLAQYCIIHFIKLKKTRNNACLRAIMISCW